MEKKPNMDISYFTKNLFTCPVCTGEFRREELRTGRGRLIAGSLTPELRRNYEVSQKYGEIIPIVYPVTVCPHCLYATFQGDFEAVPSNLIQQLSDDRDQRRKQTELIVHDFNFEQPRRLQEGLISYLLAVECYDKFPPDASPVIKQAVSALRAAWLSGDLHRKHPSDNWDYLRLIMYRKAQFLYKRAIELEQTGEQGIGGMSYLGPDMDKNYAYDGALYIMGLLEYRYGPRKDPVRRLQALDVAKRTVARIFGMGKASKNKPAAILDNARDVYDQITAEINHLQAQQG